METLLQLPNLIAIKGNHDEWFLEFIETGYHPTAWTQGGAAPTAADPSGGLTLFDAVSKRIYNDPKIQSCLVGNKMT